MRNFLFIRGLLICGLLIFGVFSGVAGEAVFSLNYTKQFGLPKGAAKAEKPATFEVEKDCLVVDLHGAIAKATLQKKGEGDWPASVVLRLHTNGMEHFEIVAGETKLSGFVQSHGTFRHFSSRNGVQQKADDPKRLQIELKPKAAAVAIPHKGFFEITVPADPLKQPELHLSWIDFYR